MLFVKATAATCLARCRYRRQDRQQGAKQTADKEAAQVAAKLFGSQLPTLTLSDKLLPTAAPLKTNVYMIVQPA